MHEGKRDFILVNSTKRKKSTRERWLWGTFSLLPMKIDQEWTMTITVLEQIPLGNKWNTITSVWSLCALTLAVHTPSIGVSTSMRITHRHKWCHGSDKESQGANLQWDVSSVHSVSCSFPVVIVSSQDNRLPWCLQEHSGAQMPGRGSAAAQSKSVLCVWQQRRAGLFHWADYCSQGWQALLACKQHVSSVPCFRGSVQKQ